MQISIVIPMYNEGKVIADTARTLSAYMQEHFESYEILFSNDGSRDDSAKIVRELALPNVRVTGYEQNQGKGAAVRHAMLEAEGDLVMFTDADLAYGCDVIGRAYDLFLETKEAGDERLILGSRNLGKDGYEGYSFLRKVMSKVYIRVLCLVGGFRMSDSQCGCKAFEREAAREIFRRCHVNGFAFDFEAILWADKLGFGVKEMPVKVINHGESKVHVIRDTYRMLRDLRKIRKDIKRAEID